MQIRDRIKEFRRVPASELRANPKNWRKHPVKQRKAMEAVLAEIGFAGALLARESEEGGLVLIDGHLRTETAENQLVPVLVLDVNEAESDKILATFDPLSGLAEVDSALLASLTSDMKFDVPEFGDFVRSLTPAGYSGLTDEDAAPDAPQTPITTSGDLWILGKHRLLCGDSTKVEDVARLLDGVEPGLMVTDPPYGVNYNPTWRDEAGGQFGDGKTKMRGRVANDDRCDWSESWALFPGDVAYVWHASLKTADVLKSLELNGFQHRAQIIWSKQHFTLMRQGYHWQHEPCWYVVRAGGKAHWTGDRTQTTIWEIRSLNPAGGDKTETKTGHGTQKPVECMRRPILNHTNRGQAVYDPFVGSGTTIIAAETTGRACYAIDIDPTYVDVTVKRWEDFTGKKATRIENHRTAEETDSVKTC